MFDNGSILSMIVMLMFLTLLYSFEIKQGALNVIGMFLEQSYVIKRKTVSMVIILLASLAFTLMYKSVLISQLTKPDEPRHLNWIWDLPLFGQNYQVFVWSPSFVADYVRTNYPQLVESGHFLLHNRPNDPQIFQKFKSGSLAYLEDSTMTVGTYLNPELNPSMDCKVEEVDLYYSKQHLNSVYMGPIASKAYPHGEMATKFFGDMKEFGFDTNERSFHPKHSLFPSKRALKKPCDKPNIDKNEGHLRRCSSTSRQAVHVLTMENLQQFFIVYAVGNCLALIVFLLEKCSSASMNWK